MSKDPFDTEYRRIFVATYGAIFAGLILRWLDDIKPGQASDVFDKVHTAAVAIAIQAAERGSKE
jgi:hypothetical protein